MTTTQVPTKPKAGQVAEVTELERLMQEDAGRGVSTSAADNIIPTIRLLQPLSPEVLEGPGRVPDAAPGDFLVGDEVVKGKEGFWFQPCHWSQAWFEFVPRERGGGFVAVHPFTTADRPPPGAQPTGRFRFTNASGNDISHWRQLAGIAWRPRDGGVEGLEYNMNFTSTGHTVAKEWSATSGRANRQMVDGKWKSRPLFGHVYKLTSVQRRNASGQWFIVSVGPPVLLGTPEAAPIVEDAMRAYAMGRALEAAFKDEAKAAAVPQVSQEEMPF